MTSIRNNLLDKTPLTPGSCEWCGKECEDADVACSLTCEAQLHRLEAMQGRAVIRSLKRWRMKPNHAARNEAIAEIVPLVERFLRIDQKRREAAGAERRKTEAAAKAKAKADEAEAKKKAQEPF